MLKELTLFLWGLISSFITAHLFKVFKRLQSKGNCIKRTLQCFDTGYYSSKAFVKAVPKLLCIQIATSRVSIRALIILNH